MAVNTANYHQIIEEFSGSKTTLVAVSKTKPKEDIEALYAMGQRDFGENYVQELLEKQAVLPKDIHWHFIGHLQSNKVKYIAPFVYLIHGVDGLKLLTEINKQGQKCGRIIPCLLQMHIAMEETKFGMDELELDAALDAAKDLPFVHIKGLMGMASFSDHNALVKQEFERLQSNFLRMQHHPLGPFPILSMGMSGDYRIAMEAGSNMVRIGSLLFGERNYKG